MKLSCISGKHSVHIKNICVCVTDCPPTHLLNVFILTIYIMSFPGAIFIVITPQPIIHPWCLAGLDLVRECMYATS